MLFLPTQKNFDGSGIGGRNVTPEIGRSSFRMEYELVLRGTDDRVADGSGVIVWVDYGTGRSIPLPEGLKAAIRGFEGMD